LKAPIVHYAPTPRRLIKPMLDILNLSPEDVVFDLGCGDARLLIEAARRYGSRCVGIEIRSWLVKIARRRVLRSGVADKVDLIRADFFRVNLSHATAIILYLSTKVNEALKEKFDAELKEGTRIISLDFPIPGWIPDKVEAVHDGLRERKLYLYVFKKKRKI